MTLVMVVAVMMVMEVVVADGANYFHHPGSPAS